MNQSQSKIYVICGQTATGKTNLAIELAKLVNGEVISADSRQIYTGLDISSNKVTSVEMQNISHHMLSIATIGTRFTVADFQRQARTIITDILSRGKTPIVCGGTGLYIDSVMFANYQFDQQTEKSKTNSRHSNNVLTNKLVPYFTNEAIWIGLHAPREFLLNRITDRIVQNYSSVISEITNLIATGINRDSLYRLGLEPTHAIGVIEGRISQDEYIQLLATKTIQYAKRQMTWFRRNSRIVWYDISRTNILELASDIIHRSAQ